MFPEQCPGPSFYVTKPRSSYTLDNRDLATYLSWFRVRFELLAIEI